MSAQSAEQAQSDQDEYRQFAQVCVRLAARAKDENERQIFLEMADAWTRLAFVRRDDSWRLDAPTPQ
jgi:hypothetical protein